VNRDSNKTPQPRRGGGGPEPPKTPRHQIGRQLFLWAIVLSCMLVGLLLIKRGGGSEQREITLPQFEEQLEAGNVEGLVIRGNRVIVTLRPGAASYTRMKMTVKEDYLDSRVIDRWKAQLPKGNPEALKFVTSSDLWPLLAVQVVPLLLLVLLIIFFLNRQMRMASAREGALPFLKSNVRLAHKQRPNVTFDDVAGVDEAKEELQETVEFLKNPERFQTVGGRIPRGILLVGYPGTGKTLLAKAVAGEANVPFFSLSGSDFVELFVGVGAARVRDLFQRARENQPCIIFLDEIDAVGRKRGTGLGGGHDEREQTLNAILSEMDGFNREDGVIVLAATNRSDVLDPALLRPGRFDREIVVDLPDLNGRLAILEVHTRKVKTAPGLDLRVIARGTPGFSGADLEAVVNEAAILAATKGKKWVEIEDLEEARDKVRFGREKKSRVMSEEDRVMTAYHESGHALAAMLCPDIEPLHKVTIIPRGLSLGMTMVLPEKDKYGLRKRECEGMLVMQMAGRVAEELFCQDVSSGAKDDIEAATKLARKMVTQWGMSERLGPVSYSDEEEHVFLGSEITRAKKHGEQISQQIDEEIRAMLHRAHAQATKLCQENAATVRALATALLKLETLTSEQVQRIMDGVSPDKLLAERQGELERKTAGQGGEEETPQEGTAAGDLPAPARSPA